MTPGAWTTDFRELDYDGIWAAENGWGHQLALKYQLEPCRPIMCCPDDGFVVFEDRRGLRELTFPTTMDEIIEVLVEKGLNKDSVKVKDVHPPAKKV
ncbi:uncharacterized protein N7506_004279 [Penicillium brevicompactum]|uniref:uncharacterized protein n=1 Tax=Penicillium brevicompactum TaxID=5074 RepID=UPI00254084E8|nr:uncharacterized protein N7506_004279 [Penicillium brevicompactum]KAJ5336257.1 hypothetical protein N7506_004279 [Penicillium brevicompactum]